MQVNSSVLKEDEEDNYLSLTTVNNIVTKSNQFASCASNQNVQQKFFTN